MATDVERLIISLEARFAQYERELARANRQTDTRVRQMQARFDGLGGTIGRMQTRMVSAFGVVGRAFGVLGIALSTRAIVDMTSQWTDLESRVNNAAGSIERGAAVMGRLTEMARRTYSSLTQTAEGYLANEQALSALGYSTQQQLDLVETLNNSMVISATRGQAAQSVMEAWSKAMAEGELRGQNLNTIIQRGGRLSKALADSMGVSVNELRRLGSEGKITTDVMFGVTSQLERLRDEADAMPATVSDGMALLGNAVLRFVGEADKSIGSSSKLAEMIVRLSDAIGDAPDEPWFDKFFRAVADFDAHLLEQRIDEILRLIGAIEYLQNTTPADAILDLNEAMGGSVRRIEDFEIALAESEQALASFALNTRGRFGEVDEAAQALFKSILEGSVSAEEAEAAIRKLAGTDDAFAGLQDQLSLLVSKLFEVRDAAVAARLAADNITADLGEMPSWRQFRNQFGPDLSDDGRPGGPITPPGRTSGSRGRSPQEQFDSALEQHRRRTEMLRQETALRAALNPLVNDYGYALEKMRAQQELENAATRAGLALGPERRAEIEKLAEGYAQATVEAAKLAEAQAATVEQMENMRDAARDALQTIVDGFLEGKDAGEIFGNVLRDIGRQLIGLGMNSLFGSGQNFGMFGNLFGIQGRERGGPVRRGQPYIVGERRPELFVPDQNGTIVPRVPSIPQGTAGGMQVTFAPVIDARGADVAAVARLEQVVARQQLEFEGRVQKIVRGRGAKWR